MFLFFFSRQKISKVISGKRQCHPLRGSTRCDFPQLSPTSMKIARFPSGMAESLKLKHIPI